MRGGCGRAARRLRRVRPSRKRTWRLCGDKAELGLSLLGSGCRGDATRGAEGPLCVCLGVPCAERGPHSRKSRASVTRKPGASAHPVLLSTALRSVAVPAGRGVTAAHAAVGVLLVGLYLGIGGGGV